jgi:hypothetical protein
VSTLSNEIHKITVTPGTTDQGVLSTEDVEKIEQGKEIIRAISELKHDMGRNKVLTYVQGVGCSVPTKTLKVVI